LIWLGGDSEREGEGRIHGNLQRNEGLLSLCTKSSLDGPANLNLSHELKGNNRTHGQTLTDPLAPALEQDEAALYPAYVVQYVV
jgi:hypothetical protein